MDEEYKKEREEVLKTLTEEQLLTLTEARMKERRALLKKAQLEKWKALLNKVQLKPLTKVQLKDAQLKEREALSTLDNASVANMKKLEEIGDDLLHKNVARVNLDKGVYWPVHGAPTNTEELARFAGLLSKERKRRTGYSKQEALLFLVFLAATCWKR
jgi:hypothetical protein